MERKRTRDNDKARKKSGKEESVVVGKRRRPQEVDGTSDAIVETVKVPKGALEVYDPDSKEDMLERLVQPIGKATFLREYFKKKALVLKPFDEAEGQRRVASLENDYFFNLNLADMLENTASEKIFAWLPRKKTSESSSGNIGSIELANAQDAITAYSAGASLYFRSSQEAADELIRTLSEAVGLGFGARYNDGSERGEIETFVTQPGNVTDFHFDYMENFTIQLAGRKKWTLHKGKRHVEHPLRGSTPHYKLDDDTLTQQQKVHRLRYSDFSEKEAQPGEGVEVETVELSPGTIFYFPAGMWHRVEAIGDEPSVSINFSLMNISWADLIADSLRQVMWSDDRFRAGVMLEDSHFSRPTSVNSDTQRGTQAREYLRTLLEELGSWLRNGRITSADILTPVLLEKKNSDFVANESKHRFSPSEESSVRRVASFRVNPLAVIVGETAQLKDEDNNSDEEIHGEEDDESEESEEREKSEVKEYVFFVHSHFGNEEMTSAMKTTLIVPLAFREAVEWFVSLKGSTNATQLYKPNQVPRGEMSDLQVAWLVDRLVHAGYLCEAFGV